MSNKNLERQREQFEGAVVVLDAVKYAQLASAVEALDAAPGGFVDAMDEVVAVVAAARALVQPETP